MKLFLHTISKKVFDGQDDIDWRNLFALLVKKEGATQAEIDGTIVRHDLDEVMLNQGHSRKQYDQKLREIKKRSVELMVDFKKKNIERKKKGQEILSIEAFAKSI